MFINQKGLFFVRMWQVYFTCRSHWFAVKTFWQDWNIKKIVKSSQTFWNTETYPSCKPQNNGRKCDILNNKPEFLFYRPSIYRHRYHSTKKYVTKQIGLSKLNAILILSFEWKLILKAETLKLIWHNWALF